LNSAYVRLKPGEQCEMFRLG